MIDDDQDDTASTADHDADLRLIRQERCPKCRATCDRRRDGRYERLICSEHGEVFSSRVGFLPAPNRPIRDESDDEAMPAFDGDE